MSAYNTMLGIVISVAQEDEGVGVVGGLDDNGARWLKITFLLEPDE